jgi:hypothetical protein
METAPILGMHPAVQQDVVEHFHDQAMLLDPKEPLCAECVALSGVEVAYRFQGTPASEHRGNRMTGDRLRQTMVGEPALLFRQFFYPEVG